MAGIFGVCHFDDRPIDPVFIARMSATLAHDGRDGEALIIEGSTALGSRVLHDASASAPRPQPVRSSSGIRLVFDGRLDNRDELIPALRDRFDVSPETSDAELAAACYTIDGIQFAGHLLGDFALAVFDGRKRCVLLARDAMGIRPLYYRRTQTSLLFGSTIKTLLADPDWHVHPNNQLLAELLLRRSHRRPADDSTLFAGVRQVPPAHVVVFTAEGAHPERYWDFDCHRSAVGQSFGDYSHSFRVLFERAVSRRLRSTHPVAIAVSGGLDSSSIFCAAASAVVSPLVGLTYTSDDGGPSDERAFVREVERTSGRTILQVHAPMEGLLFQSADMIRIVEAPMLNGQWFRGHRLMNAVTASGARTLLTGHWGDQVLFDQAYLVDLLRSGAWRTDQRTSRGIPSLVSGCPRSRVRDAVRIGCARTLPSALGAPNGSRGQTHSRSSASLGRLVLRCISRRGQARPVRACSRRHCSRVCALSRSAVAVSSLLPGMECEGGCELRLRDGVSVSRPRPR